MFDQDINFLPDGLKKKEQQEKQKLSPKPSAPKLTKPEIAVSKMQEPKIKFLQKSFFKKIVSLFTRKKVPKIDPVRLVPKKPAPAPKESLPKSPQDISQTEIKIPKFSNLDQPKPNRLKPFPGFTRPQAGFNPQKESTQVNLMPNDLALSAEFKRKAGSVAVFIFLALLLVGLGFLGVRAYAGIIKQYQSTSQIELTEIEEQIAISEKYREDKSKISKKIKIVYNLVSEHVLWSNFFKTLENITHQEITYQNFTGDITGLVALESQAKGLPAVAEQLLYLQDSEVIKDFTFSGVTSDAEGNSEENSPSFTFELMLQFSPEVFKIPNSQ